MPGRRSTDADKVVEAWNPYRTMFDVRVVGPAPRDDGRHPDRPRSATRTSPASATGTSPKAQLLGFRGAPGNTINHTTSYWVPNHSPQVFVRAGRRRVAASATTAPPTLGAGGARFHEIRRVVSNLGVFDFETPDHRMRLRSRAPRRHRRRGRRGHRLRAGRRPPTCPRAALPTDEELRLIREVLDPERACATAGGARTDDAPRAAHAALRPVRGRRTRSCRPGMGWVAGAAPRVGHRRRPAGSASSPRRP